MIASDSFSDASEKRLLRRFSEVSLNGHDPFCVAKTRTAKIIMFGERGRNIPKRTMRQPIVPSGGPGMAAGRYQSPRALIESATSWEADLNRAIITRMRELGIPEDTIGLRGISGINEGRAFVRFPDSQVGGNLNPAVNPAWKSGIALDHGVLDVAHPTMCKVPAWGQRATVLRDRVDAATAHEYIEATLTPPRELNGPAKVEWLHKEAIRAAPDTTLPITERARQILRQYRSAEGLEP